MNFGEGAALVFLLVLFALAVYLMVSTQQGVEAEYSEGEKVLQGGSTPYGRMEGNYEEFNLTSSMKRAGIVRALQRIYKIDETPLIYERVYEFRNIEDAASYANKQEMFRREKEGKYDNIKTASYLYGGLRVFYASIAGMNGTTYVYIVHNGTRVYEINGPRNALDVVGFGLG
ncbi:MAG: hypothetical protein QXP42_05540 [Candidatus Micrarchaeia archaeon]